MITLKQHKEIGEKLKELHKLLSNNLVTERKDKLSMKAYVIERDLRNIMDEILCRDFPKEDDDILNYYYGENKNA